MITGRVLTADIAWLRAFLSDPPTPIVLLTTQDIDADAGPLAAFIALPVEAGGVGAFLVRRDIAKFTNAGAYVLALCASEADAVEMNAFIDGAVTLQ